MSLNADDRRSLARLEREINAADPDFEERMAWPRSRWRRAVVRRLSLGLHRLEVSRARWYLVVLLPIIGITLFVVGSVAAAPWLFAVASVFVIAGALFGCACWFRSGR